MTTIMTIPELSKATGFSYNVIKLFCDRYDMPIDNMSGGKGKHYIINDRFKRTFQYWCENIRIMSLKRIIENEETYLTKLMEL